jgi:hypothetical protein
MYDGGLAVLVVYALLQAVLPHGAILELHPRRNIAE